MQVIRCTQKLLRELKQEPTNVVPMNHLITYNIFRTFEKQPSIW